MEPRADATLLREYADQQSDDAFAALVARHINLVYSVALRRVGDEHAAEEIAQAVFIILAKKAPQLRHENALSSWLFQATRLTACNFVRSEIRRQRREQEAYMQSVLDESGVEVWPQIAPLLDEAVASLGETDRRAIVLRYYEGRNLRDVGTVLGTSEGATEKRISRAVDRLKKFFSRRGVTLSVAVITGAVLANSVQAAPAGLAASVSAAAAQGAVAGGSTLTLINGALKLMAWTKAKIAIVAGLGVLVVGGATTVTFLKIQAYEASRNAWRHLGLNSHGVDQAPPQVQILPTRFPGQARNLAQTADGKKWGGVNVSLGEIIFAAYDWPAARIVFPAGQPQDRYDFIANVPQNPMKALQRELKAKLGVTGRPETQDVDVLYLRVHRSNAPGLMPAQPGASDWQSAGHYVCDDRALSSDQPPYQGLSRFLEEVFAKPIIDQTGLTQHFHIDLKWDPKARNRIEWTQRIQQAVLDQLGLELVPGRESVEMLVVEKTS